MIINKMMLTCLMVVMYGSYSCKHDNNKAQQQQTVSTSSKTDIPKKNQESTPVREVDTTHPAYKQACQQLSAIISQKKTALTDYLHQIQLHAQSIKEDELMTSFFKTKREYYRLSKQMEIPREIKKNIEELKQDIKLHYLSSYLNFYDILFVDTNGDIFYTIKKEKDYHQNIFSGTLANTVLSEKLKNKPNESFIDFHFYDISGKTSAFFIEPVRDSTGCIGWLVLQCSINKINQLFSTYNQLGATGEVILVNKAHYMLTESRFKPESAILKQHLSDQNIRTKFKLKNGYLSVIDYRNYEVISAFETFDFWGSEWLIIAKKNKAEILTQYYSHHKSEYTTALQEQFNNSAQKATEGSFSFSKSDMIDVDMEEYRRCDNNQSLYTLGVSTCTAITITQPGSFSYLAHISPLDKICNNSQTNIVEHLLQRINYLEVLPCNKQSLQFTIVANHTQTIFNVIDMLIAHGYYLSQIRFLYNPNAHYANVVHHHQSTKTTAIWHHDTNQQAPKITVSLNIPTLEEQFERVAGI